MIFEEIHKDDYERYRNLFNQEHCNKTFVDSAFTYKHVPLMVNDKSNPTFAYLDYKYAKIIAGDPSIFSDEDFIEFVKEHVILVVDKEKWLQRLLDHFKGRLIERRRTRMSHANLSLEEIRSMKKTLPEGYSLERINKETAENLPEILQVHIPVFFDSLEHFLKHLQHTV